ncbi:ribokinase [Tropicimonas isoalkanivorans]|uniref:Deoxyribokinase n=1 Tax=Tropicimonas isoalkanivorans TaxID=441112 RepID=A0A1I1Q357_9RHOB|nr:ribokinase [Tropicimonas isoalkanivorans]SFD16455.1 ribokinase [Tropicimonas isoalkanivorans]
MAGKIAVVGSNMVDLITYTDRMPGAGETIEAPRFEMGCGGKGANQAIAAARLGAEVMMVTKVGDDIFADNTIRNFETSGIDTRFVERVPGTSSGVAPIFVEPSGENSILIVKGANALLSPEDLDRAEEALKDCALIVMQLEVPLETVYHAVELGARHGIETLLNPAPASLELDPSRIESLTFLVPNQTELATISGLPVSDEREAEAAARHLIGRGIRTVIVTLGGRGALLVDADKDARHIEAVPVTPVDTTGAGDAFIGSFSRFYVQDGDMQGALEKAVRYAADSITRPGTQKSYADAAAFEAFLARSA